MNSNNPPTLSYKQSAAIRRMNQNRKKQSTDKDQDINK